MIRDTILKLYRKFRLISYQTIFRKVQEKEGSLSATEAFSVDVINLLHEPTITRFAEYIGISQPNATYKVNNLVSKGYVRKVTGESDRRECYLQTSEKFRNYYQESPELLQQALDSVREKFSPEELQTTNKVLKALLEQLEGL